jgi:hypothetical protein
VHRGTATPTPAPVLRAPPAAPPAAKPTAPMGEFGFERK